MHELSEHAPRPQDEQEEAAAELRVHAAVSELAAQTAPGCMLPAIAKMTEAAVPSVRAAAVCALSDLIPGTFCTGSVHVDTIEQLLAHEAQSLSGLHHLLAACSKC